MRVGYIGSTLSLNSRKATVRRFSHPSSFRRTLPLRCDPPQRSSWFSLCTSCLSLLETYRLQTLPPMRPSLFEGIRCECELQGQEHVSQHAIHQDKCHIFVFHCLSKSQARHQKVRDPRSMRNALRGRDSAPS